MAKFFNGSAGASDSQSNGFFKPKEHSDAKAILFEVHGIRRNQNIGNFGPKDVVDATVTVFNSKDQLSGDDEPLALGKMTVDSGALVKAMDEALSAAREEGEAEAALIARLRLKPAANGKSAFFVPDGVDMAIHERVVAYVEKRDGADDTEGDDALPDF